MKTSKRINTTLLVSIVWIAVLLVATKEMTKEKPDQASVEVIQVNLLNIKQIKKYVTYVKSRLMAYQAASQGDQSAMAKVKIVEEKILIIESVMEANHYTGVLYSKQSIVLLNQKIAEMNKAYSELKFNT